ncbi:hypothetical protein [Kibdelosporangium philippinense]|uniref:hypothetical protein n=1 Tax=Kibdelosporangium philippinense TaxID=211113 RepID=UPI00361A5C24
MRPFVGSRIQHLQPAFDSQLAHRELVPVTDPALGEHFLDGRSQPSRVGRAPPADSEELALTCRGFEILAEVDRSSIFRAKYSQGTKPVRPDETPAQVG